MLKPPTPAAPPAAPPALATPPLSDLAVPDPVSTDSGGSKAPVGGGAAGPTLASCMEVWKPDTDMTRAEWKATCLRTLNGVDLPAPSGVASAGTTSGQQVAHRRTTHRTEHASRANQGYSHVASVPGEP